MIFWSPAAVALDRFIAICAASATGIWRYWYHGDLKMNLPWLVSQTRQLANAISVHD